jgi:hypothetical protein
VQIERKKQWLSSTIVASWLVLNLVSMLIVKSQWLEYSFVARAQQSARSYLQVLNTNEVEKYQLICILEHNRGQFGTEDGNMINHLKAGTFSIVSTTESITPPECATDSALILVNDAWAYSVYDKRE